MSFAMLTEFNGQPIRQIKQDNKLWISLTDCAKANNKNANSLIQILQSKGFQDFTNSLNRVLDLEPYHVDTLLHLADNTDKVFSQGRWLNIHDEVGQDLLIYIAQRLSPDFHVWSNRQIRKLITNGYAVSEQATSTQLANLQSELDKALASKAEFGRRLRNRETQLLKLVPKLDKLQEAKNKIVTEDDLSNAMHLLWSKCGKAYYSEYCIKPKSGFARLDSVRKTGKYIEVIEFKLGTIGYEVADDELFVGKKYAQKLAEHWQDKLITFCLMGIDIDEAGLDRFIAKKADLLGENIELNFCQLDQKYFRWLKQKFIKLALLNGLTVHEAQISWQRTGCAELVQSILDLAG